MTRRKYAAFILITMLATVAALAQTATPAATAPPAAAPAAPAAAPAAPATPAASTTAAEKAPAAASAKLGIINIQQAILATNEGQRDFQELQKKFEPKQTELQASNKEIEDLKKQLNTQGDKLNEEARASLLKNIDAKQKTMQRSLEDAQADFQSQQNDIANRIGGKMLTVLDKYAKDNSYTLIMDVSSPQSPVLWAGASTDLTKAIVDAYNAQSNVAAPLPSAPAPAKTPAAKAPATSKPAAKPAATAKPATKQ